MIQFTFLQKIVLWAIPTLFAITVHEVAHGWVANKLGDKTAKIMGRLTLNPLKHIDPIGTVLIPIILYWAGGFIFGWAKPVPVNPMNFNNPKRDTAIVATAGPVSNLIMTILWALIAKFGILLLQNNVQIGLVLNYMGQIGIFINLIFMILNLIPIPPLDGSKILMGFLSNRVAAKYNLIEPYGFFIIVILLITGIIGDIFSVIVGHLFHIIFSII